MSFEIGCSSSISAFPCGKRPIFSGQKSGLRAKRLLLLVDEDGDGYLNQSDLEKALALEARACFTPILDDEEGMTMVF